VELPNFKEPAPLIPDNPLRTAEISTEQNFNQIDGILNNQPTAGEKEKRTSIVKQLKTQPVISKEKQKTAPNGAEMER
jgi:DNA repair protein RadC